MRKIDKTQPAVAPWRDRIHEVIFEADTTVGKWFDLALLVAIVLSVAAVLLESVDAIDAKYHLQLEIAEWTFTILFTIEYILRIICVRRPWRYIFSFFGLVDLLAILPAYVGLFIPGAHDLLVVRALRLLRVFRVLKLARYLSEASLLRQAIWASRAKIIVFLTAVLCVVVIMGAAMHLVEGHDNGFNSIPQSMYWAITTMATVGYGDIVPVTPLGKFLAAIIMVLGYSFIIVPTGIISAELAQTGGRLVTTKACRTCSAEGHDADAVHCKYCGDKL